MTVRTASLPAAQRLAGDALLVLCGASATAAAAHAEVPWLPVPFTLQTLAVTLCGLAMGARRGAAAQVAYLAAGVSGLPAFAGGGAGPAHLAGPTGGYLVAFPLAAYLLGLLAERGWTAWPKAFAGALIGNAVVLLVGALWLTRFTGAQGAWAKGVLPFLTGAVAKSVLAAAAVAGLRRVTAAVGPLGPR